MEVGLPAVVYSCWMIEKINTCSLMELMNVYRV
jgi:hypothetical protein